MPLLQCRSFELSSEKFGKLDCALCLASGNLIDSLSFCVECKKYYCPSCIQEHLKSIGLSGKERDVEIPNKPKRLRKVGFNLNQPGIQRNHRKHDESCSDADCSSIAPTHKETYWKLTSALREKQGELQSLETQREAIINRMNDFKDNVNDLLLVFEKTTKQEITEKQQSLKGQIDGDIQKLAKALKDLENTSEQYESDIRLPKYIFREKDDINDENGNLEKPLKHNDSFSKLQNILVATIEDFIYRVNKIGSFVSEESASVFLQQDKHSIKLREDRTTCDINDMCCLEDGSILLCDWNNSKIQRLDRSFQPRDQCPVPSIPWSICSTGTAEMAVSLFLQAKIQFLKVSSDTMSLTTRFKVGEVCRGLCYTDNKLLVSCGGGGLGEGQGHIRMFTKAGDLLKIFQDGVDGRALFSCPAHIALSQGIIYTTDKDKGLISFDWYGQEISCNTNFGLAKGLCLDDTGNLFICDFKTGTVVYLNIRTNSSKVLVTHKDQLTGPQSVCYDNTNKRLVVASGNSNFILTYRLTQAGSYQ